jgi:hypothetical protein
LANPGSAPLFNVAPTNLSSYYAPFFMPPSAITAAVAAQSALSQQYDQHQQQQHQQQLQLQNFLAAYAKQLDVTGMNSAGQPNI